MKNNNSLIALAYIKESENPFEIFCNYILYCINSSPDNMLRHDELVSCIEEKFGLRMPHHMMKVCTGILHKEKKLIMLSQGRGYSSKVDNFDVEAFDKKREDLKRQEEKLIENLILFVKDYNLIWTDIEAKDYLTDFLLNEEQAYNLFVNEKLQNVDASNQISPNWYIGNYVTHLLKEKNSLTKYLISIVCGLMIYIGIHQTDDYNQEKKQNFNGTDFYLDTKLLLRVMGFSWDLEVKAANELIDLITKEYGGNICVFNNNIDEIENALTKAANSIDHCEEIADAELRIFSELKRCDSFDFKIFSQEIRKKIEDEFHFNIQENIDWQNNNAQLYNLDWGLLISYIQERHVNWNARAITNDVDAINYINVLRNGDYSVKFGGQNRRPIFITTNFYLINDIRDFLSYCEENDEIAPNWKVNKLPIISDHAMMCRLWLPKSQHLESIPALTLARNASVAQNNNIQLLQKIKKSAKELKSKHKIDIIDLDEIRKGKIEELLVKKTSGNIDDITPDIIANSIEELIRFETLGLKDEVTVLKSNIDLTSFELKKSKEQIVLSATERLKNKVGVSKILIMLSEKWWIFNSLLFGLFAVFIWLIDNNSSNQGSNIVSLKIPFIIIILTVCIKIFESFVDNLNLTETLICKSVEFSWNKYKCKISDSLIEMEKVMEKEIIQSCLENSEVFLKHKEYCKID